MVTHDLTYAGAGDHDTHETTLGELAIDAPQDLARFEDRARALAMQGYIITAVGRGGHTLLLVGTRAGPERRAARARMAQRLMDSFAAKLAVP